MTRLQIAECRVRLSEAPAAHEAPRIREYFGEGFEQTVLQANRHPGTQQPFQYPRVQFKFVESAAVLIAMAEGAECLMRAWSEADPADFPPAIGDPQQVHCELREEKVAVTGEPLTYRVLTPWLGLNEKNFRAYTGSRNTAFRKDELSRILVGNCLGMAKSLGIRLDGYVEADGRKLVSIKTKLRNDPVIGFIGTFQVNLRLPDLIGLGRAVARGFGTVMLEAK
jgi:hypothetical protein